MTASELLARTGEKVQCRLPGCDVLLPVKVSCHPRRGEELYDVVVAADPEALRRHLREAHRPAARPPLRRIQ